MYSEYVTGKSYVKDREHRGKNTDVLFSIQWLCKGPLWEGDIWANSGNETVNESGRSGEKECIRQREKQRN